MIFASLLVLTTACLGSPPPDTSAPPPVAMSCVRFDAADARAPASGAQSSASSSAASSRSGAIHEWGLGGMFGVGPLGSGIGLRYWFLEHVGLDTRFLLSRAGFGGFTTQGGFSFEAAPSLVLMITAPDPARAVDIRPYVGAGMNWTRAGTNAVLTGTPVTGSGVQAFAGVEIGFGQAESLAVSGEVLYDRRSTALDRAGVRSGTTGIIAFHYYMK